MKKISVIVQGIFYVIAGLNHFLNPEFYLPLIPDYFLFPDTINYFSGAFEILFGIMILRDSTRKVGTYLIILMLGTFIPSHVYFIQIGGCIEGGLCVSEWIAWVRLIVIHPLLIWWAWSIRNYLYSIKPNVVNGKLKF